MDEKNSLRESIVLALSEAEGAALSHLLVWLDLAIADDGKTKVKDMASEFTPAELDYLASIRQAFTQHDALRRAGDGQNGG